MRVGLIALVVALLAILFFSGCLSQQQFIEGRMDCIELSANAKADIPECDSQEKCMEMVGKNFFSFNQSLFSYGAQQKLLLYQNQVARSWLFFNRALKNARSINELCSGNDFVGLEREVNELKFNLETAFEAVDQSNKTAFVLLALEKADLEGEKIDLAKEEPLYDDLIKLNNNLNELSDPSLEKNSDSFVSVYFQAMQHYNVFSSQFGQYALYLDEFSVFDLTDYFEKEILAKLPNQQYYAPFIKKSFSGALSYLISFHNVNYSLSLLKGFPSFDFFNSVNEFAGLNGSVVKSFSDLMKDNALHREQLINSNNELQKAVELNLSEAEGKLNSIDSERFSAFDENFFASLFSLLEEDSSISVQSYSLNEISSFKENSDSKLFELKSRFNDLKQKDFLKQISLGEKTAELKQLNNETAFFLEEIDFFSNEVLSGLEVLCNSRVDFIKKQADSTVLPEERFLQLIDLKSSIAFKANAFGKEKDFSKKLLLCRETVQQFNSFNSALSDFESFKLNLSVSSNDCFDFLEKVFSSSVNLNDFRFQYAALLDLKNSSADAQLLSNECLQLRQEIESFVQGDESIQKINSDYAKAKSYLNELKSIRSHFPELVKKDLLGDFEKKFSSIDSYFSAGKFSLLQLDSAQEIQFSLDSLIEDLQGELDNAVLLYLKQNFNAELFSLHTPELNKPFVSKLKLVFNNPFNYSIDFPKTLSIPFALSSNAVLSFKSSNLLDFWAKEKDLFLDFSNIPKGLTVLEFDFNSVITAKESNELLFVSQEKAIVQKTLQLSNDFIVPKLNACIELIDSLKAESAVVLMNEKQLPSMLSGKAVCFSLEEVQPKQKIDLFNTYSKPLSMNLSINEIVQKTDYVEYSFVLSLKNNSPFEIKSLSLLLPLNLPQTPAEKALSDIKFFDSQGKSISFSVLSNDFISFDAPLLLPFQSTQLFLRLTAKDSEQYWNQFIEDLKNELISLSFSENQTISFKANDLLNQLDSLCLKTDFESKEFIQLLTDLKKAADKLSGEEKQSVNSEFEFIELKKLVQIDLNELSGEINQLAEFGLTDYAKQLFVSFSKASAFLELANESAERKEFDSATSFLLQARSLLSSVPFNPLNEAIEKKRIELMKLFEANSLEFESVNDSNFSQLKEKIFALDSNISRNLMKNNSLIAAQDLNELNAEISSLQNSAEQQSKEKANEIMQKILEFNSLFDSATELFNSLNELFRENLPEGYVPSISSDRLTALKLQFDSIDSLSLKQKLQEFENHFNAGSYSEALSSSNSFLSSLESKLSKLKKIHSELSNAFEQIKGDAVIFLNSAQAIAERYPADNISEALQKANDELQSGNFFKSISLSKSVSGMVSLKNQPFNFSVPLAAYPLLALICVFAFIRHRKKKNKKPKQIQLMKVPRNY